MPRKAKPAVFDEDNPESGFCGGHEISSRPAAEGPDAERACSARRETGSPENASEDSGIDPPQPGSREALQVQRSRPAVADRRRAAQDCQEGKLNGLPSTPAATAPSPPG